MKPAPFAYARAETSDDAVDLLNRYPGAARVLAGGQSLIPMLNMRLTHAAYLVDINGLEELRDIFVEDGFLVIGALARHADVEANGKVRLHAPMLQEAASRIGHPQIRYRGTAVGSIAHADPSAQLPAAFAALAGEAVVQGPGGVRSVSAEALFVSECTTSLRPCELVTHIRVPLAAEGRNGWAFLEVSRQKGHFPLLAVAATVRVSDRGVVDCSVALAGMGPIPVRAKSAESILRKGGMHADAIEAAAEAASEIGDPYDDVHATRAYRRRAAFTLVRRALQQAVDRGKNVGD